MQKHAFLPDVGYEVVFSPLPMTESGTYYDRLAVGLPKAEDFPYLHYHDCYEVGVCESGRGLFLSEGEYYSLEAGDLIFVAPGKRHYSRSLKPDSPCCCRFSYFSEAAVHAALAAVGEKSRDRAIKNAALIPAVLRAAETPIATALLKTLTDARGGTAKGHPLRLAALLLEADSLFSLSAEKAAPAIPQDMRALAEHLSLHYNEEETAAALAAAWHLSESQLRRRFAAAYGKPPIAFRNALRVEIAAELLVHTELSVADVADRVGYSSPSDLYRAFRAAHGMSPLSYRRKNLG